MADIVDSSKAMSTLEEVSRWLRHVPLSRWLLIVGSFGALALAFLPWLTVTYVTYCFGQNCQALQASAGINPFLRYIALQIRLRPSLWHLRPFTEAIVASIFAPGIVFCIWVRGHIRTWGQRVGVVIFSGWFLLLVAASIYVLVSTLSPRLVNQQTPVFSGLNVGIFLAVPVFISLWFGLLLAWRELWRNRAMRVARTIQPLAAWEYVGAGLVTLGMGIWFIGYNGIYWLLPTDCPPTPLFGEAACNNRFSAETGFQTLFKQGTVAFGDLIGSAKLILYWSLSAAIMFGGLALIVSLWIRHSSRADLPWVSLWVGSLVLLWGLDAWGIGQLAAAIPGESWTNGAPITLIGIGIAAGGLAAHWRGGSVNRGREAHNL